MSLFLKTKESERELIRSILSQIADFLKADDTERARKLRQSGTSGNEMAQIFEQLANSEVSLLSMQMKKQKNTTLSLTSYNFYKHIIHKIIGFFTFLAGHFQQVLWTK